MSMPPVRSWNVVLAAAGAVALIVEGQVRAKGGLSPRDYVLAVAAAVPLAWGTRAPLLALAGVAASAILCDAAFDAGWAATGVVAVQRFAVALLGDRQRSRIVGALTAFVVIAAIVAIDGSFDAGSVAIRVPLVFLTLAVGDTVRSRQALRAAARERAEREAREREEEGRRRAAEERVRIARELHDTLAHSLVAINVRAGVALDLDDSQDSSAALEDVKQASATALRDLRATLGLLRDRGEVAPTAPVFDLEALPGLVENARASGVHAEDQPMVRAGFRSLLDSRDDFEVVGEAATGSDALEQARAQRPDVVVMDIRMPEMDGLEATRRITSDPALAATRVLVLTTFELDEYVFGALDAGASGFLLKGGELADLVHAIRVIATASPS